VENEVKEKIFPASPTALTFWEQEIDLNGARSFKKGSGRG